MTIALIVGLALAGGLVSLLMTLYAAGGALTSDGQRYLEASSGKRVPRPFHMRWALPAMLPPSLPAWAAVTWPSLVLTCPVLSLYLVSHGTPSAVTGALIWASLTLYRVCARCPVLVDAPALLLALASALVVPANVHMSAVVSIGAGLISERAPIFAALWGESPWPLLGMIPVAIIALAKKPGPSTGSFLKQALSKGRKRNGVCVDDLFVMLAPWGAVLVAFIGDWNWVQLLCVAVAYSQLTVASDKMRLYQWAAPSVLRVAMPLWPKRWLPLAVAITWFNPWGRVRF